MPVNPSIGYMKNNFNELNDLFNQLRNLIFEYAYVDRDVFIDKVQCYYHSGQYAICKKVIRLALKAYPTDEQFLKFYEFLCEYMGGDRRSSYHLLKTILSDKPHLVSSRGFLEEIADDPMVKEIIDNIYSPAEMAEFNAVVGSEAEAKKGYIRQATALKQYYQQKSNNNKST